MFSYQKNRWFSMLAAAFLCAISFATPRVSADEIKVENPLPFSWLLSDLLVYGANGESKVILEPGNSSDDVKLGSGEFVEYDVPFKVVRYYISSTTNGGDEYETFAFDVTGEGLKVGFLQDIKTGMPVVLVIDQQLANFNPQPGDGMTFRNGVYTKGKGIFAALQPDFENGGVSGAFSGRAKLLDAIAVVTVTPGN